jgi:hypothetical protein
MNNRKIKKKLKCSDRHHADSRLERFVDDLLYRYGVKHSIHPKLPGTKMFADFLLLDSGIYVEVWGDIKLGDYEDRKKEKLEYYKQRGLKLIEIESPTDALVSLKEFLRRGIGIEEWAQAEESLRKRSKMMEDILEIDKRIEELRLRKRELVNQYNKLLVEEVKRLGNSDLDQL